MGSCYLRRLEAVEERLGIRDREVLCIKCVLRKYRADGDGSKWSGCDGTSVDQDNLDDLSDEELDAAIVTLKEIVCKEANGELPSST
jgi:hypothetical protein